VFLKDHAKTAIFYKELKISYKDLLAASNSYTEVIPVKPGERIVIFSETRPEWAYAFYASWRNKAIVVPFDAMGTADDLAFMLDDCKPTWLFHSDTTKPVVTEALKKSKHSIKLINLDIGVAVSDGSSEPFTIDDPDETALMIYTSGTTGAPKGVMLTYKNLISNIDVLTNSQKIPGEHAYYTENDMTIAILPLHHIYPLMGTLVTPLFAGGSICMIAELNSDTIFETLQKHEVTIIAGVPRLYSMMYSGIMAKINKSGLARLLFSFSKNMKSMGLSRILFKKVQVAFGGKVRFMASGGAKLPIAVGEGMTALGFKILEGFGMSESSPMITFNRLNANKLGTVGTALPNVEVKIENDELLARGSNIMKGYYNRPDETASVLENGWLHTGDKASIDKKGFVTITGRLKDIIVLPNGKNINPVEIEEKLTHGYTLVKDVGIIEKNGNLFAVLFPDFSAVAREQALNIRETIKHEVIEQYNLKAADYKKILNFEIVDQELPRTRIGKLKRFELTGMLQKSKKKKKVADIPTGQEYKILVSFIRDLVDFDAAPDDHIELDLGLDSLNKLQLQEQCEKNFGVQLTNEDLIEYATVRKLSEYIAEKKTRMEQEKINWSELFKETIDYKIPAGHFMLRLALFFTKPLVWFYFHIKKSGIEAIPDSPVIFVPNHQSMLDGLFIQHILSRKVSNRTYFIAKARHFQSRFRQFFARNGNVIVLNFNQNLKETLLKSAALLKKGKNLVIFPEGTRSRDGSMLNFKKTFAIISKELNIPVVPVVIEGAFSSLAVGKKFPKSGDVVVKFLDLINPSNLSYDQIKKQTEMEIEEQLKNIKMDT